MVLLFSLFFQALIGITQFYLQESPAVTVLGMAHHEAGDLGAAVVENNNGRWLRAYGSFDHPNIFGGVMMVATGLVLLQLLRSRKGEKYCFLREIWDLVRIKINKRSKSIPCWEIGTKMLFVFFIVFVSALFFSFSRSAWLGLIIIFISLIVILALKSDWQEKMTKLLKTILLSLILLSPILIFNGDLILSRTLGSGRLEISSLTERVASFSNFESIISSSWLTGVGLGNYSLAAWLLNPNYQGWAYQPVHNTLAFIWAEGGILVLLSFLAVIISIIYNLVKRNNEDRYSLVIVLGIIALFFFDHWLASLHFGVLFFWLILGLLIKKEECIN
jgi:O-antigen ligase